jgi:hypothetical protein
MVHFIHNVYVGIGRDKDLNKLFVKFDISPNATDVNSNWGTNSQQQVKTYNFSVYDVTNPEEVSLVGKSLDLNLTNENGYYQNVLNVTIDEDGTLTTLFDGSSDVSGNFGTSFQFAAPKLYRVDLKAKSGNDEYSDVTSSANFRLEKLPTIIVNNPSYGEFINHTVTDYEATFHINISDTVINSVYVKPSLKLENLLGNTLTTTDNALDISTGPTTLELVFDISNNTLGNKESALFTDKVFGQFDFSVNFVGGHEESLDVSSSSDDSIKTMEEVYTALGVELHDISLNSDSAGDADGFKLTINPSTEIFELKNVQPNIIESYNQVGDQDRSKLTSNLKEVLVSGGVDKVLLAADISDNLGKYVFDVPASQLGKNLTYNFRIVNDVSGEAPSTTKDASLTTRVNDVRVIDTSFNNDTFTISNKRGYQLDLAILKNQPDDVLEILHDGELNTSGEPNLDPDYNITGEKTNQQTFKFTDDSLGVANTELIVSLLDQGEGANNKKEVFSIIIE